MELSDLVPKDYEWYNRSRLVEVHGVPLFLVGVEHNIVSAFTDWPSLVEVLEKSDQLVGEADPAKISKEITEQTAFYMMVYDALSYMRKPLHSIDPLTPKQLAMDEKVKDAGITMQVLGGFGGVVCAIDATETRRLSRRGFLAALGGSAATFLLGNNLMRTTGFKGLTTTYDGYTPEEFFTTSSFDYRNVMIAKGLDLLAEKRFEKGRPVSAMYGALHPDHIQFYLKHPSIRQAKELCYALTFRRVSENVIRSYSNMSNNGFFELANEEPTVTKL